MKIENLGQWNANTQVIDANEIQNEFDNVAKMLKSNDYMSFEVFPTSSLITAGSDSGVSFPIQDFTATELNPQKYSVEELVKDAGKIYTCIKTIPKTLYVKPGVTTGWEEYWQLGSIDFGEDAGNYKYKVDVPVCATLKLSMYSYSIQQTNCKIVVDFGDGKIINIKDLPVEVIEWTQYDDCAKVIIEYTYTTMLNQQPGNRPIVKVYGDDFFMLRCSDGITLGNNLVSKIFEYGLNVSSNLKNVSSVCYGSKRIVQLNVPYEYDFKNITNLANAFDSCTNLQYVNIPDGVMLSKKQSFGKIFCECTNLKCNIKNLYPLFKNWSENSDFTEILSKTQIYGNIDGSIFWNNPLNLNYDYSGQTPFYGMSTSFLSSVPEAWGGTSSDSVIAGPVSMLKQRLDLADTELKALKEFTQYLFDGTRLVYIDGVQTIIPNEEITTNHYQYKADGAADLSLLTVASIGKNILSLDQNCFNNCLSVTEMNLGNVSALGYAALSNNFSVTSFKAKQLSSSCYSDSWGFDPTVVLKLKDLICTVGDLWEGLKGKRNEKTYYSRYDGNPVLSTKHIEGFEYVCPYLSTGKYETISASLFYDDWSINDMHCPNVLSIGQSAFNNCQFLSNIYFPKVTKIDSAAFRQCSKISAVCMPTLITLCDNVFKQCSMLSVAEFVQLTALNGTSIFDDCTTLTRVFVPNVESLAGGQYSTSGIFTRCNNFIVDFRGRTLNTIPTVTINAFGGKAGSTVPTGVSCIVPDSLYENWLTSGNWPKVLSSTTMDVTLVKESEF